MNYIQQLKSEVQPATRRNDSEIDHQDKGSPDSFGQDDSWEREQSPGDNFLPESTPPMDQGKVPLSGSKSSCKRRSKDRRGNDCSIIC
jgi:hypothetical protein